MNFSLLLLMLLALQYDVQFIWARLVDPIIDLPLLGKLKGRVVETAWTQREIYQFVDVKYAESPSGENRFKPPVPVKPWSDVYEADVNGIGCPSVYGIEAYRLILEKSNVDLEDCLTMTISTPNITGNLPVLVYLHGEFLYDGNNLEGSPDYLLEKDIIVVSPQYRLGPFGFLSTRTEDIPGNAGVLDVVMALQWIKYFIPHFGGDPNRITLMGQVSGAAIIHLLTISPVIDQDLFHQVIYQSGSALMPIFLADGPEKHAIEIGAKVNCSHNNVTDQDFNVFNDCMRNLTVVDMLQSFYEHLFENTGNGIGSSGAIQFTIGGPSPILPKHPLMLNYTNNEKAYPTMGGTPKNVGSRVLKYIFESDFQGNIPDDILHGSDYISYILHETQGFDSSGILTTMLKEKFFTPEIMKNGSFKAMLPGLIDLTGMIAHKIPVLNALSRNARLLPNRTFLYSFDYKGQFNRFSDFDEDFDIRTPFTAGVTLTDENIYLFPYPQHVEILNAVDKEIARRMVELWSSFVTTGVPTTGEEDFYWPPLETGTNGPYLKINLEFGVADNYYDEFTPTILDELDGNSLIRSDYNIHAPDHFWKNSGQKKLKIHRFL